MIECNCPGGPSGIIVHVIGCPLRDPPVGRTYRLVSGGLDREFDALGVCIQALAELEPDARIRAAQYLLERARGGQ